MKPNLARGGRSLRGYLLQRVSRNEKGEGFPSPKSTEIDA